MKYTESWTWTKSIRYYTSSQPGYADYRDGLITRRPKTYLEPWMEDYRKKIQEIATDAQASHAIQPYWRDVVRDWQAHLAETTKGA